jgi:hypothetical protein
MVTLIDQMYDFAIAAEIGDMGHIIGKSQVVHLHKAQEHHADNKDNEQAFNATLDELKGDS